MRKKLTPRTIINLKPAPAGKRVTVMDTELSGFGCKVSPNGCELIVCWKHNWKECPLEVIELRKVFHRIIGTSGHREIEEQNLSPQRTQRTQRKVTNTNTKIKPLKHRGTEEAEEQKAYRRWTRMSAD